MNCLVKIDNNTFASGSNDCKIYIWDYKKRIFLFELAKHEDCVITLIKLNDGRLCSGSADMTIKIWNLEKKECERELIDHKNWIKSLYQLKNGILLSSDDNNCLIIWKNFSLFKSINCSSQYRNFCNSKKFDNFVLDSSATPDHMSCVYKRELDDNSYYYKIVSYMYFDIPVVGNYIQIPVSGETKILYSDSDDWKTVY